jgi:hypothetical protein
MGIKLDRKNLWMMKFEKKIIKNYPKKINYN